MSGLIWKEKMKKQFDADKVEIDYAPFYECLKKKGMSQNCLYSDYGISSATFSRMKHRKNMTLVTVAYLMDILGTDDIHEIVNVSYKK